MTEPSDRHRIPRRARGAVLNWFGERSVPVGHVYRGLQERAAFGDYKDLVEHLQQLYGTPEVEQLERGIRADLDRSYAEAMGSVRSRWDTKQNAVMKEGLWQRERSRLVLLHLPDALFATAIEVACNQLAEVYGGSDSRPPDAAGYINTIFGDLGIPYRLDASDRVEWVGDKAVHDLAVEPALLALGDARMATAAEDFDHALANLRRGTAKARKDAVNDGTKALEGAMVVVLTANGRAVPSRRQVWALWEAMRDELGVPQDMMELLTAGSKVSNARGRHTNPNPVSQPEAEASVTAAATAIAYISSLLP